MKLWFLSALILAASLTVRGQELPASPSASRFKQGLASNFARISVQQQQRNLLFACGCEGSRWHTDHERHYQWAITAHRQAMTTVIRQRQRELNRCENGKANPHWQERYAETSVMQQQQNILWGCGFSGRRWHADYDYHFRYAATVRKLAAYAEIEIREQLLERCSRGFSTSD